MAIQQTTLFEEAKLVIQQKIIRHVAIIMDGNRRWAKQHNLPNTIGHDTGRRTFKKIVTHASSLGLECLTTYAFSTENWGRDKQEVGFLMNLFIETLKNEINELAKNNIRLKFIGRKDRLDSKILKMMEESEYNTSNNTGLTLQIAFDYGGRFEIAMALKNIVKDVQNGILSADDIDEKLIDSYLYTKDIPDPDLIIRTGGEYRLSNYLLWQSAYSELHIIPTFWPAFSQDDFDKSIIDFSKRQRRWGKD